ncbi:hypothetical protein JXA56_00240 [Candidatus Micrarchaeota archaeon]|nr:hypothetical protein [Candidatus Micrarchaeota archaeon]
MIEYYVASGIVAFFVTYLLAKVLIPRLKSAGITGNDVNKTGRPEVAEMGGIAIVAGFSAGMLLAIFFHSFLGLDFDLTHILAAVITIFIIALIGIIDDLLDMPQWLKATVPLFAAIPLVAINVGYTTMSIPFLGVIDFGIIYVLVLIPVGIAVASNLTNMLAGFNGMEAGMGAIIFAVLLLIGISKSSIEISIISVSMLFSLLAFLFFNKYPAKLFPGDVGNLTIGVALASAVVIGNIETAGAILIIPYVIDFFIKLCNRFPSTKWWGENRDGKLYPVDNKVRGFAQLIMKLSNGITEQNLVFIFIGLEAVFGAIALILFF